MLCEVIHPFASTSIRDDTWWLNAGWGLMSSLAAQLGRIEGYAIVSVDGMPAEATGMMPEPLKFDADQMFFEHGWLGRG